MLDLIGSATRDDNGMSRIASILRPLSLLPDASPFEIQSLGHFIQATSPTLIALEIPHENPNYIYIPLALTSSSKALFHALVASGSAHALNWKLEVDSKQIRRSERTTLKILSEDLMEFSQSLREGKVDPARLREKVNSLLAVLQTLVLYATTAGDSSHKWRKHMDGASYILTQIEKYEQTHGPLVLNTFLLETIKFLDVQSALSLNCGTKIVYRGLETGWSPNHTVGNNITGMNGFSAGYLEILGRICNVSAQLNPTLSTSGSPPSAPSPLYNFSDPTASSSSSSTSYPHFSINAHTLPNLKLTIDQIFQDLEDCRSRIKLLEHDQTFRTSLMKRLSLGNHSAHLAGHFIFADVIYYASHVYLARTLTSSSTLPKESLAFVYSGLDAISLVPGEGSAGNLLGWALIVVGTEIENDEAGRGIIRLRMKSLGLLGHLNLNQTSVLMEEVWKRKDERNRLGGGELITWQGVMASLGWDLLVV